MIKLNRIGYKLGLAGAIGVLLAVGMAANLGLLQSMPLRVLAVTSGFLAIKLIAIMLLGRASGHSGPSSWRLGFTLPAGGEFAFVLFTLAARERIIEADLSDLLVLSVTLSMMIGPLLRQHRCI